VHCIEDNREGVETGLVVGNQIIGAVNVALVDLRLGDETVDVDRMLAFDRDRFDLFVGDLEVNPLIDLVASALISRINDLPVSSSISCCLSRLPVFLLICRNATFSVDDVAEYTAIGQETSESLRQPFQYGRGGGMRTPDATNATDRNARPSLKFNNLRGIQGCDKQS
jgi:hypothetical protein